jgi:hypothetical protein
VTKPHPSTLIDISFDHLYRSSIVDEAVSQQVNGLDQFIQRLSNEFPSNYFFTTNKNDSKKCAQKQGMQTSTMDK